LKNEHFLSDVNESWTLFLDRDGVINNKLQNDYVKHISEFDFLPNVLYALHLLKDSFYKIIVVTNQQGIAKGLMNETSLSIIHQYMIHEVEQSQGSIDDIYHCPHFDGDCSYCRKPNIGMAIEAQKDYPFIDFKKSIMIGDSESDMDFGMKCGMYNVFIGTYKSHMSKKVNIFADSLIDFAKLFLKYKSNVS
jgi:histidinol-phosphate phosphatase family protein